MSSDASETHFFMCACPLCTGSSSGFSADGDTVTGGASAPPVFTLSQIQTQLRTQWGGNQEGKTWTWLGTTTVSYSIDTAVTGQSEANSLVNMTPLMEDRARLAFELWDDLIALTLNESPGNTNANITFNYSSNTSGGGTYAEWSGYSSGGNFGISRAYIWLNNGWSSHNTDNAMAFGGYGFMTYLHEIGHTLGLSHPGTYDASNGGSITYANSAEYAQDSHRYTVMSYFDANEAESFVDHYGSSGIWRYAQTPLLHDIAAIQAAYGADTTTRTGDTVYGFNSTADRVVYNFSQNPDPILVIWDSGGTDTLDCSGYSTNQLINLTAGSYSNIGYLTYNVAIAFNCTIENATGGTGADTINGNSANNVLLGGNGADTIDGADGNDTLNGGAGNDTMWGGAADDAFVYSTGADTIKDFTVGAGGVDEIDLRGVSGVYSLADVLSRATQVGANTVINFGGGNTLTLENINKNNLVSSDFLFSAPPAQNDLTASGFALNGASISFTINNTGADPAVASTTGVYLSTDSTITSADTLAMSVSTSALAAGGSVGQGATLTLPGNLTPGTYYLGVLADYNGQLGETNETNNGSNTVPIILGNNSANTLNGTSGADTFFGLAGDDWVYAGAGNDLLQGGDGLDRMDGGAGADIYDGGAGYDYARYETASSGVTASLANPGANTGDAVGDTYIAIEGLVGSNFSDTLVGDGGDNQLWGLDGNDTLDGGAGNDSSWGMGGDDTFVYSTGADAIKDFTAGTGGVDEIDLRGVSGIYSLADVLARATQVGANTVIDFGGGNTLTLDNINKTNLVSGDFLFSAPPAQADLTASGVALNATSISFTINNIGTAASSASTTGIYLSTDSTITGADTLVTSMATSGLAAGGSVNQGTTLTFPGNLTPGTYYLGVLADYNGQITEGSESNNVSNTVPIILGNDSVNALTGTSGADTVFGLGGDDTINGGAGNDQVWGGSGDDTFVYSTGADTIKDFTAGADGIDEIDLRGVSGVYSLADVLARATQVGPHTVIDFGGGNTLTLENIDKNNLVSGDFLFSAPPAQIDLTASSLVLNGTSVSFTINNIGANTAAGSTTGIYLSTDSTITSADTLVTTMATSGLAAGASANQGTTLTFPGNLTPGTYYLGVLADYNGQVGETNEANNASNTVAVILGNDSANTLNGTSGVDTLFGLAGDDWVYAGADNDMLLGGDGLDRMDGGAGADVYDGGAGYDYARYESASSGVTASLANPGANTGDAVGDTYIAIEGLVGSNFNDTLIGNGGDNQLWALDGNDTLDGGAGNDSSWGMGGDDTFVYSTGADTIADFIAGAGGVDEIDLRALSNISSLADVLARATQVGANTVIDFGGGNTLTLQNINKNNLVSSDFLFASAASPAQNDLTASGVALNGANISFTINNTGADPAVASTTGIYLSTDSTINSADTLLTSMSTSGLAAGGSVTQGTTLTLPGNLTQGTYYLGVLADYNGQIGETNESNNGSNTVAVIVGNDSVNTLNGTSGADTFFGLAGDDWVYAGAGNDVLLGGGGLDRMDGGAGADVYDGGTGYDYARYESASSGVTASLANPGANTGDAAGDSYIATEGLVGSNFSDTLIGDGADNQLWGLDGNDTFDGGAGNDQLWGMAGDDTFVYSTGVDAIRDFTAGAGGVDEIDLRAVSGVTSLADVQARATQVGANTVIDFGNGNTLTLDNINKNSLVSSDFLFT